MEKIDIGSVNLDLISGETTKKKMYVFNYKKNV